MKMHASLPVFFIALSVALNAWAAPPRPSPVINGKTAEQMTAQEVKDANKELDAKIKKGDSSAVQQKADLNNAFDKTPQGQRAKKEDELQKKNDELAIAEKEESAMKDKETDAADDRNRLERTGDYWESGHHWPAPPDGNIGPGGDRNRRAEKLKKEEAKARKAAEEAGQKIKKLKDEIEKLKDELYVKTKDTKKMDKEPPPPSESGSQEFQFHHAMPALGSVSSGPSAGESSVTPQTDATGFNPEESRGQELQVESSISARESYNEPAPAEPSHSGPSPEPNRPQETTQTACPPDQK